MWKLGLIPREPNFVKLITFLLPVVIYYICDIKLASHMGTRNQITFAYNYQLTSRVLGAPTVHSIIE